MDKLVSILKAVFLHKRMKSLYWRVGGMVAAELAAIVPVVAVDFNVPQWFVVGLGLVLGEITKYLNKPQPV